MTWEPPADRRPGPALAVCGGRGSGRTTFLRTAARDLGRQGLAVALLERGRGGLDVGRDEGLDDRLRDLLDDHDLVLVEGHEGTPLPKVWLATEGEPAAPLRVRDVLAVLPPGPARGAGFRSLIDAWLPSRWRESPLLGGVLVGGRSERMGRPKQLLRTGGATFLERIVAAITPHVSRVVLLGSGSVPIACGDLERIPDAPGIAGPPAGVLAAMRWARGAAWLIVATDMPLVSSEAVAWLLEERAPGRWAILPRTVATSVEPLFALYEAQSRSLLERAAAAGTAGPAAIAGDARVHTPSVPPALRTAWRNVNDPRALRDLGDH
jgi:molybdopterin-guanine dinucleotide biosynthesis protein A